MKWLKQKAPKGCIFCGIARGDKSIPSKVVFRDRKFMVIMNTFPYNTGHVQVIPLRHVNTLDELGEDDVKAMFTLVNRCVKMIDKALDPAGFNIGLNQGGEVAGASIAHLHVHVVPRYKRDFGFMEIISGTKVLPQTLDETFRKLKQHAGVLKG